MAQTKSPRKASDAKSRSHAGLGKKKTSSFLKSLPESVEHIEIVQQVACVLEELQQRVLDVREEASKELKKIMNRYESNYKGLETKVHNVTSDAKRQAQTSMIQLLQKWHEHKEKLPAPLAKEIEKIIEQIGAKVVARASAPRKSAPKARATKAATKPAAKPAAKKKPAAPKSSAKPSTKTAAAPKKVIKASTKTTKVVPMADTDS